MDGASIIGAAGFSICVLTFVVGRLDYRKNQERSEIAALREQIEESKRDLHAFEVERQEWFTERVTMYKALLERKD